MVLLFVAVLTSAQPTPLKLASPGLRGVGLDASVVSFYSEHTAQALKLAGIDVITDREMQSLLGLERQKQLLGCSEGAGSCMAELANALGADGVLLGDVAKSGTRYQVNLKIIASQDGRTLALFSDASTEDGILDTLTEGANKLALEASRAAGKAVPVRVAATRSRVRPLSIIPLVAGAALLIGGTISLIVSENAWSTLDHGMTSDGAGTKSLGQLTSTLAFVGFGVGGAALVTAALMYFLGGDSPAVGASVGPTGAQVTLSGAFP